jgi:hypothetical protein
LVQRHPRFFANPSYEHELRLRVDEGLARSIGDVLEIGGIDRPFLSKGNGYCYVGLDVEDKPRCRDATRSTIGSSCNQSKSPLMDSAA